MDHKNWLEAWRVWLQARFPELQGDQLQAAAEECEVLRSVWRPLVELELDNGELPFPHSLPARDGAERP